MKTKNKIVIISLACLFAFTGIVTYVLAGPLSGPSESLTENKTNPQNQIVENYPSLPADASTSTKDASKTSVRGGNAFNSNAGFTSSDSDGSNALVFRMGLAQLTNEDVVYANDIDELNLQN